MPSFLTILALSLGGALGANTRYLMGLGLTRWLGSAYPWATLSINLLGAFLIGVAFHALPRGETHHEHWRALILVGFLGGFTTFSTLTLETLNHWEAGQPHRSWTYPAISIALGMLAVYAGARLARASDAVDPSDPLSNHPRVESKNLDPTPEAGD